MTDLSKVTKLALVEAGMLRMLTTTHGRALPLFDTFLIELRKQDTVLLRKKHTLLIIKKLTRVKTIATVRHANLQSRSSIKSWISIGSSHGSFDQIMLLKVHFKNVILV